MFLILAPVWDPLSFLLVYTDIFYSRIIKMESKDDASVVAVAPNQPPDGKLFEPDEEFEMRMCCGQVTTCDKALMEFLAKTVVSLSVLSFCFIQLSNGEQSEFASSTISLILGTYLGGNIMTPKKRDTP